MTRFPQPNRRLAQEARERQSAYDSPGEATGRVLMTDQLTLECDDDQHSTAQAYAQIVANSTPKRWCDRRIYRFFGSEIGVTSM